MNIFAILEGIISTVPKAVELYHELVPLISPRADIDDETRDKITAMADEAHQVVQARRDALKTIVDTAQG